MLLPLLYKSTVARSSSDFVDSATRQRVSVEAAAEALRGHEEDLYSQTPGRI